MCVLIAKYFPKIGWVGVKNRDRNYIPTISFRHMGKNEVDKLLLWDEETEYSEGINNKGISVLSTSLMVKDDEKEGDRHSSGSKDGPRIRKVLNAENIDDALKIAIDAKVNGHTGIFDQERFILLESSMEDGKYVYKWKEIPKDQTVSRTNHGIWLPHAGYQLDPDNVKHSLSRISSEARMIGGEIAVRNAEKPIQMLDNLIKRFSLDEPQLNPLRIDNRKGHMFSTGQIMIVPSIKTMYFRPVRSYLDVDLWKLNAENNETWLEILGLRPIWDEYKNFKN